MTDERIEIVSATRADETSFSGMPIAQFLTRVKDPLVSARIFPNNKAPLPVLYNSRLDDPSAPDILVFVHDDVWLEDFHLAARLADALTVFDVVGVAGSTLRVPQQPTWFPGDFNQSVKDGHLSGAIGHHQPLGRLSYFGPTPRACVSLDGVFLAVRRSALAAVRFDEQFAFHCYDIDFCRTAELAGLRIGTWPIAMSHKSTGRYLGPAWRAARDKYLQKWPH